VSERSFGRISVIQATYGRTDRVACARGIPNSQTSNTSCLANATNKVSHRYDLQITVKCVNVHNFILCSLQEQEKHISNVYATLKLFLSSYFLSMIQVQWKKEVCCSCIKLTFRRSLCWNL